MFSLCESWGSNEQTSLIARPIQGLRQARQVFLKAKKTPNLAWQVVEASGTSLFASSMAHREA